ncbi:MAG: cysteine desulfurase-like protein, partial [Acidimicrobiia bacterium]
MPIDISAIRHQFDALNRSEKGHPVAYLDGPGGTQTPQSVIAAMGDVLSDGVSNLGGGFGASAAADDLTDAGRRAVADFFNANPNEISFGQNMTSLTFALSRALARSWKHGDAIVLTSLDHDANFTPWKRAAEETGVEVRVAEFDPDTAMLEPSRVSDLLDDKVRLVAVCRASNALGSLVDVSAISAAAHEVGALVYVDAVHAGPHVSIDVQELGCDFLVASAYKFFGPHTGILWGRLDHMAEIDAYKVRPAPSDPPGKWETGTQSFESLAGVTAAVDYIASLGEPGDTRREGLTNAFQAIGSHETELSDRFIGGVEELPAVRIHGPAATTDRVSTFAVSVDGASATDAAAHMADHGIYVWSGHYYA